MATITEIRERSGITKMELSKKYDIPYSTLQKWERGESNPPAYVINLLDRLLQIDFPSK